MKATCPHCHQHLELDDAWAGQSLECPTCGETFKVTRVSAPPPARQVVRRKSGGPGCGTILLLLCMLVVGAFCYAMYRWQEAPIQTWQHLSSLAQQFLAKEPTPAPTAPPTPTATPRIETTPAPTPSPTPTPRPDPLTWLIEHKEHWPPEVKLQKAMEFPAVSGGKRVGSLQVPAGAAVKVVDLTETEATVDFLGGQKRVAIAATDLLVRADAALTKAEAEAEQAAAPSALETPAPSGETSEEPQVAREASREEINVGLGAIFTHHSTIFRIFAPTAKAVRVVLYDQADGAAGRRESALGQKQNGLWELKVSGNLRGKFYTYALEGPDLDPKREVLDPYATNSVASSTRARITELPPPPRAGPPLQSPTDAVIYEMQVRDFTIAPSSGVQQAGLYLGWTEAKTHLPNDSQISTALDHLSELGVTHVELLPMQDFENDESERGYNWGYITSAFFSPEGMFATDPNTDSRVREFKALVDALHARGLGVILDVVYNHTSGNASFFGIAPQYYYRHTSDGALANASGCGNEFRSEAPLARKLIIASLKFWVKEYGIDGFRFDLMALLDQPTLRQAEHELRALKPGILLYGEPWKSGDSPLRDGTDKEAMHKVQPIGAFNDDFRNALKGFPDGDGPGWIQDGSKRDELKAAMLGTSWLASPAQSINYMTCHDNLVLWDKLEASMPGASEPLREETMKLGYLALFTSQGVPFIQGGEEFARTKGGNNNSYNAPDSVNQVDWELKKTHRELFQYVRDLIALRKAHPLFRLRTPAQVASHLKFVDYPNENLLIFTISGAGVPGETWSRACVILNSAGEPAEVTAPGGSWSIALDAQGATPGSVAGKVSVPAKSGFVLYQR